MKSYLLVSAVLGALMFGRGITASAQESATQPPTNDNPTATAKENVPSGHSVVTEQQRWRYRWHNGRWWYWLPSQRWVYWSRDHWEVYLPPPPSPEEAPLTVCRYPTTSDYNRVRASSYYGAWGYGGYGRGRYRGH